MRREIEIEINGRKVKALELTVRQIKELWKDFTTDTAQDGSFLRKHWNVCITGIALEELDDFTPGEIKKVYDAFEQANTDFFDLALKIEGENPMIKMARTAVLQDLLQRYVALSKEVMQEPGTTDTASS